MAARAGMTHLISVVREMTGLGTADYSDDQMQGALDRERRNIFMEPLRTLRDQNPTTTVYLEYLFDQDYVEASVSGTAAWRVENSTGALISDTNYTVNYDAKQITFSVDQGGTAYYLSYRAYDAKRAAAGICRAMAARYAARFDIETDNHSLKRSQLMAHYTRLAAQLERDAPARIVSVERSDAY